MRQETHKVFPLWGVLLLVIALGSPAAFGAVGDLSCAPGGGDPRLRVLRKPWSEARPSRPRFLGVSVASCLQIFWRTRKVTFVVESSSTSHGPPVPSDVK